MGDDGVLRLYGPGGADVLDPAGAIGAPARQILRLYTRQLFTYAPVPDPRDWRGTAPVPDIAADIPSTYNAGMSVSHKVCTVTLRPGVRWDTTPPREVTAQDFVRAFKRLCAPTAGGGAIACFAGTVRGLEEYRAAYAAAVPGADATAAEHVAFQRAHDIPGIFAVDHDMLVFELERPTADFLHLLALPATSPAPAEYDAYVPGGPEQRRNLRSTGPYRPLPPTPDGVLRLERNPAWRPAGDPVRHQYLDAIEVTDARATPGDIRRRIGSGRADLAWGLAVAETVRPAAPDREHDRESGREHGREPGRALEAYLVFNLANGHPTGDIALRRATAFAVDKQALAHVHSDLGSGTAVAVARTAVPPGNVGHAPGHDPYPAPGDRGDPERAGALLAETTLTDPELVLVHHDAGAHPRMARSVAADLERIGLTVRLAEVPHGDLDRFLRREPDAWDVALTSWAPQWYGDNGRAFLQPLFQSSPVPGPANHGGYADPEVDRAIMETLGMTDPDRAAAAWAAIDRKVMADAPIVPLLTRARPVRHLAGPRVPDQVAMPALDHAPDLATLRVVEVETDRPPAVPCARSIPAASAYLCGLTYDGRRLWQSDQDEGRIYALDPARGERLRTLSCPKVRADLTYHDGRLWQVGGRPKRLILLDPETGEVVAERAVDPPSGRLCGVEAGPEGLWMCLRGPSVVQLRDFADLSVQREFPVPAEPSGLTRAPGLVIYSEFETGIVRAFDTRTEEMVGEVAVEGHPTGLTWDGYQVWYCDFEARRIRSIRLADLLGRNQPRERVNG